MWADFWTSGTGTVVYQVPGKQVVEGLWCLAGPRFGAQGGWGLARKGGGQGGRQWAGWMKDNACLWASRAARIGRHAAKETDNE